MDMLILTAYTLRHLTTCHRHIWLDRHADPFERVEVPTPLADRGNVHEDIISEQRYGPVEPVGVRSWREAVEVTRKLMASGVDGIRGAALERTADFPTPITVRGQVDWLRRVRHAFWGTGRYAPVEIKQRQTVTEADQLQLDLYLWLLEGVQGEGVTEGFFLLGTGQQEIHTYNPDRLMTALAQAVTILEAPQAPPVFLASHCELCPWQQSCSRAAYETRDITLLPGLKRETWVALRDAGLATWDDLSAQTPKALEHFRGLGPSTARTLHAYAQAFAENAPRWLEALSPAARQPGLMLDLETRLDDGQPWCFGWLEPEGAFHAAVVDAYCDPGPLTLPGGATITIVPDSDTGWKMVATAAAHSAGPVYHWSGFERTVLRATAPAAVTEVLDGCLHDLHRTFRQTCVLPARGTSIKVVAGHLGLRWPQGSNALTAWSDYLAWLGEGDASRLARAVAYNRADVEALALIQMWLVAHAP